MRDALQRLRGRAPSHVGLAYDVWVPVSRVDGKVDVEERRSWLDGVREAEVVEDYAEAFARWKASFAEDGLCQKVETTSRVLVGHGNPSGSDVGLTVQHTWGVPMIPGSALAGVLAGYVHEQLAGGGRAADPVRARWRGPRYEKGVVVEAPGELYGCLFGVPEIAGDRARGRERNPGAAGRVTFCDALWVPGEGEGNGGSRPFAEDVLTVHHRDYYGGEGAVPPTDHDDPNPVSFLGVGKGVRFLLALCGPAEWTAVAMSLLLDALAWRGVGGKTSAGYGRLRAVADDERAQTGGGAGRARAVAAGGRAVELVEGPELRAFTAWLAGELARKTHARALLPAIEREWLVRLVGLVKEERLVAARKLRKAIVHRKYQDAAKALSQRIERGG
jgi:CRISPR-associated protein Cmr6